jgi:putative membrane protein
MVAVGTLIGWFTNYLAIKLLFRPYKEMNFFFFKIQGLIPKRRDEISENIADVVERELISVDDIENKLKEVEFDDGMIEKVLDKLVEEKLKKSILEKNPLLKMIINDSMVDKIKKYFKNMILENKDEILSEMIKIGKEKIDFKEIILEKMKNFSLEEIEKIILSISKNELKHIEIIGGVLGGLIAVFQFLFMVLLKQI